MDSCYGIEWKVVCPDIDGYGNKWRLFRKYKTQRRMLQAINQLRKNIIDTPNLKISNDSGKTWHECYFYYRPIHLYKTNQ